MKYIKNNLDYAISFEVKNETGRAKKFEFDCKRIYQDTGNIATTGVTAIEDEDFIFLMEKCPQFKKFFDESMLSKTSKEGANAVANKIDELTAENEKLKAQLEQKKKEANGEELAKIKKENEDKEATISDLKAQLEALKKNKKSGKKSAETEETPDDF